MRIEEVEAWELGSDEPKPDWVLDIVSIDNVNDWYMVSLLDALPRTVKSGEFIVKIGGCQYQVMNKNRFAGIYYLDKTRNERSIKDAE